MITRLVQYQASGHTTAANGSKLLLGLRFCLGEERSPCQTHGPEDNYNTTFTHRIDIKYKIVFSDNLDQKIRDYPNYPKAQRIGQQRLDTITEGNYLKACFLANKRSVNHLNHTLDLHYVKGPPYRSQIFLAHGILTYNTVLSQL